MIGNVREWAEKANTRSEGLGQIVGATWVLGERSFEYDFEGSALPMQNTNLDVGFRVARSVPLSLRRAIDKCRADRERNAVTR